VVPRDIFGNVLALREFHLSDKLQVVVDGPAGQDDQHDMTILSGCEPFCRTPKCDPYLNKNIPCDTHMESSYQGYDSEDALIGSNSSYRDRNGTHFENQSCSLPYRTVGVNNIYKPWTDVQCMNSTWQSHGDMPTDWDPAKHNERHFETEFVLTVSGMYIFSVRLDAVEHHSLRTVEVAAIDDSPFWINIVPAELDPTNTRTLSYFVGLDHQDYIREPTQYLGQWVTMHLQTRDRYDNVRCLDLANDTLTIGVTRLGKIECDPEHANSSSAPSTSGGGNTPCVIGSTVKWHWTNGATCTPRWDVHGKVETYPPSSQGGCYEIEFRCESPLPASIIVQFTRRCTDLPFVAQIIFINETAKTRYALHYQRRS
jgi:hypothetical protein